MPHEEVFAESLKSGDHQDIYVLQELQSMLISTCAAGQFREERSSRKFLLRHSSTLKELCLVKCAALDDPRYLARFGCWGGDGRNMLLSDVEINIMAEGRVEGVKSD